jgi:hypothetical protein
LIIVIRRNLMKKTSLVLAISALLYGTSSVYVLADDVVLSDFITETGGLIDSTVSLPEGFDDPQPLPLNVAVDSSNPIHRPHLRMCNPSFAVNGPAMAEFPVTVNKGTEEEEEGIWSADGKTVTGTGWTLKLPVGDTWNATWKLIVTEGTVDSILLEPSERNPHNMWYAFDIGGKFPKFPEPREEHEHTPDAARGQFIVQRTPGTPPPIFEATYSGPVYTTAAIPVSEGGTGESHDTSPGVLDSTSIPLYIAGNRKPTHDLYSTLLINFPAGLTGEVAIDPGFGL